MYKGAIIMNHPLPRGWQEKKISDISEVTSSKRIYEKEYVKNGIPFYRGKEITLLKNKEKIKELFYISEERYIELKNNYGVPKKNDILITAVGTIGNAYMIDDDKPFYFKDGNLIWLKNIKEYPKFLEFLFEYNQNKILEISMGSSQKALTIIKLENLSFYFPPLDEQKRIADILSTFDDLIANLNKLIEKKEIYKKGVMQRVLTGKVRFNGFTDEWEEVYIKDVGTIITGNTPSTKDKSFWGGKHVWVTPTDINKKDIDNSERKLTDIGLSKARKLPKNTLLVTCIASIGKNSILRCEGSCNQQINAIIPNKNFSAEFLYYIFENNKEYLNAKAPASATKIISKTEFEKLSFILPKIEEQNKIAELLTLIDKDIEILKQLLHLRKLQKKGVMQKLLTGEVRI